MEVSLFHLPGEFSVRDCAWIKHIGDAIHFSVTIVPHVVKQGAESAESRVAKAIVFYSLPSNSGRLDRLQVLSSRLAPTGEHLYVFVTDRDCSSPQDETFCISSIRGYASASGTASAQPLPHSSRILFVRSGTTQLSASQQRKITSWIQAVGSPAMPVPAEDRLIANSRKKPPSASAFLAKFGVHLCCAVLLCAPVVMLYVWYLLVFIYERVTAHAIKNDPI